MADYDGEVRLGVELEAGDIKRATQELKKDIKSVFDAASGKEADKSFKQLESSMSKVVMRAQQLEQKLKRLEETKTPTKEYEEINDHMKGLNEEFDKLLEEQDKMVSMGLNFGELWNQNQQKIEEVGNAIRADEADLQELVDTGKAFKLGTDTEEYEKTANQLADVNNQMRLLLDRSEQYDMEGEEIVRVTDSGASSMRRISESMRMETAVMNGLKKAANEVISVLNKLESLLKKVGSTVIIGGFNKLRSALMGIGNESRRTSSSFGGLLKTILMYSVGVASLQSLFNKLRSAVVSGLSAMAQMNGGVDAANASINMLNSSLAYLQNSWAAAFAPIVNYVTPVLIQLIDTIAAVANKLAMLFAALTGAGSYMRAVKTSGASGGGSSGKSAQEKFEEAKKKAQEKYEKELAKVQEKRAKAAAKAEEQQAKAAEKLAKAQEKANGQLQNFDELNVITIQQAEEIEDAYEIPEFEDPILEEPDWNDFANAGGGALEEMFEEVPVDDWAKALAEKIKGVIADIMEPLKKAWDTMKDYVFAGWKHMTTEIGGLFKSIARDFIKVWKQAKTVELFKNILGIVGDLEFVIGNIAHNIKEAWDNNFNGLHLLENIRDIFGILVQHVRNVTQYMKQWSQDLDFNPLVESLVKLSDSLKPVADFLGGVFEDIMDDAVLPFIQYLVENALPSLNTKLEEFNRAVDWDWLRGKLDEVWPAFERLAETISTGVINAFGNLSQSVANFINSDKFSTFLDNVIKWADSVTAEDIEKALTGIGEGIGKVVESLIDFINSDTFQNFLQALADWWNSVEAEDIAKAIDLIAKAILIFDFAKFVGPGVLTFMRFFAFLQSLGGGEVFASLSKSITLIRTVVDVIQDLKVALEIFIDLITGQELSESVKTFNDNFGLLGTAAALLYNKLHPENPITTSLITKEDVENAENLTEAYNGLVEAAPGAEEGAEAAKEYTGALLDTTASELANNEKAKEGGSYIAEGVKIGVETYLQNNTPVGWFSTIITTFKDLFQIGSPSVLFEEFGGWMMEGLKNGIEAAEETVLGVFEVLQVNLDTIMNNIVEGVGSAMNSTLSTIDSVAQSINSVIGSLVSNIGTMISDLLSFVSQAATSAGSFIGNFGTNLSTGITNIVANLHIPHLAQGAVIPPNSRFIAMLGDQTSGTNVEAPLDTIKQAVAETILQFGGIGGGDNGDIVINIDGREVFRAIRNQDDMYRKSNGHSAFSYEGGL